VLRQVGAEQARLIKLLVYVDVPQQEAVGDERHLSPCKLRLADDEQG
jgi:hypothetical protein